MKILIACEFSGIVRDQFIAKGHKAISCDLEESMSPGPHYKGDVRDILKMEWDMVIAHPPCTYLANSGSRWWKNRIKEQQSALDFFKQFLFCAEKVCIENPVGIPSTLIGKPTQIIQPWQFGHGETKKTCLWLHNLPKLVPTKIVEGREQKCLNERGGKLRGQLRSMTYRGIAKAMAEQWG